MEDFNSKESLVYKINLYKNAVMALQSGQYSPLHWTIFKEGGVKGNLSPPRLAHIGVNRMTLKDQLWALFRTSATQCQIED